ncbi:MAG TPA: serine/threonine-protein kinase [Kofleriaceae bacterium]|jgi:serine/threonine-protein kinase
METGARTSAVMGTDPQPIGQRYRILQWLGSGGMGAVYRAYDTELGGEIALKLLRRGLSAVALDRFRREVRLARRVVHKNVARMFDIGEHDGQRFLTMELVHGTSLAQHARAGKLPWPQLLAIGQDICSGLTAAHEAGVVHRDLKPDNILIDAEGRAIITDFGIARAVDEVGTTQSGVMVGTPAYMAPEQLEGLPDIGPRSDLFALGVMLFELATGERPWEAASPMALAIAIATKPPRDPRELRPDAPDSFVETIRQCLDRTPERRPADATAVASGLRAIPGAFMARQPVHVGARAVTLGILALEADEDDAHLAEILADEVAQGLGRTGGVRIRLMTSWVGLPSDPKGLGARLGVDHVLTGSVRRGANGLSVTLRLVNAADGFLLWAETRACDDLVEASAQLSRAIAETLATHVEHAVRPADPRAADLYLRGRAEVRRYFTEHVVAGIALLDEAAQLAPSSAEIHAALAHAALHAWDFNEAPDLRARASAAVEAALAADRSGRASRLASAAFRWATGDVARAAYDAGVALAAEPTSSEAHELAGRLLAELGEISEARARFTTAAGLDPMRADVVEGQLALLDALGGDEPGAARRLGRFVDHADPALRAYGQILDLRVSGWYGRRARMLDLNRAFASREQPIARHLTPRLVSVLAANAALPDEWRAARQWSLADARPWRTRCYALARMTDTALALGRDDLAVDCLAQLVAQGSTNLSWIERSPALAVLAGDATLAELRGVVRGRAIAAVDAYRAGLRS